MRESVNIQSDQDIENFTGGTAIGTQIGSLTVRGSLIIRPPKDRIPQAPHEQTVREYLEYTATPTLDAELSKAGARLKSLRDAFRDQTKENEGRASAQDQGASEVEDIIEPLWHVPFKARRVEDAQSEPLYDAIRKIFAEAQRYGGNQRLVLLADPGMAKTPAVREVRRQRAEESLKVFTDKKKCIIPFYIRLADLRSGQPLTTLLGDAFNHAVAGNDDRRSQSQRVSVDQMIGLLEKYTCLFMFDDLDELLSAQQRGELQALAYFMEIYQEHQFVVTCRESAYRQQLGSLQRLYLDGLTSKDVKEVLKVDDSEYDRLAATSAQLVTNRSMLESYMVLDQSSELVRAKGRFLQILMRCRLERDEGTYGDCGVDSRIIVPLLEHLAINLRLDHTHDYDAQRLMQMVTNYLDGWRESCTWRQVLIALQKTDILAYDEDHRSWRFRDRVDEALFAADAVVHGKITRQALLAEVSAYWWRDVFELLVGIAPDPERLLIEIMDQDALTAASCIGFVGQAVSDAVEEALIDSLHEQVRRESSNRRKFIVERIGQSRKPRAGVALLQVLHRDWSSMVVMAAVKALLAWSQRGAKGFDQQLELICSAEREVMHSLPGPTGSIVDLLKLFPGAGRPGQVDELCAKLADPIHPPRSRGLAALGLSFADTEPTKEQAVEALLAILEDEQVDDFVAWCTVEALTQFSKETKADRPADKAGRPLARQANLQARIAQRARTLFERKESGDQDYFHLRTRAVYLLGWLTEGETTRKLMHRALRDKNPFVRGNIVEAIARRDIKDARPTIEKLLTTERHPFVLRRAAEALGQIGTLESILVLENHLRSEQTPTRWSAREAIAEIQARHAL